MLCVNWVNVVHIRFAGTLESQDAIIRCRLEAARQSARLEVASSRWVFNLSYAVKSYQRCLADLSFALSIVNEAAFSETGSENLCLCASSDNEFAICCHRSTRSADYLILTATPSKDLSDWPQEAEHIDSR